MSVDYGEVGEAIKTRLLNIQTDLQKVLTNQNNILCSKSCKRINLQISLAIKHAKLNKLSFSHFLERYVQMIMSLVLSYEPDKYGQRFSFLSYLSRKLQKLVNKKIKLPKFQQLIQSAPQTKNKQFLYYLNPISLAEVNFLASSRVDQFFRNLNHGLIILQNSQCVCCSQVFQKNHEIFNHNPMFKTLIQLTQKQGFDRLLLARNLNAVYNAGGGVIIIGIQAKKNPKIMAGIRFKSMEDIYYRQKQLQEVILTLKPNCNYLIQKVMVHVSSINPQNIGQEFMRICFRIKIFPLKTSFSFLQFSSKGYSNVYEIYKLDEQEKPNKILFDTEGEKQYSAYTFAHEMFRTHKALVNNHPNIYCSIPFENYSKYFCDYIAQGNAPAEIVSPDISSEDQIIHKDDPKFMYEHTSLIIVGSKKQDRHVENFVAALNGIKESFEICRPFPLSFKDGARSIWMISHRLSYIDLKNLLKRFESRESVKPNCLTLMPVHRYLQIERAKFLQQHQIELQTMFKSRYKQACKSETIMITDAKYQSKQVVRYSFNSYSEGIFAYLVMQSQQLKPYFIRKGHI